MVKNLKKRRQPFNGVAVDAFLARYRASIHLGLQNIRSSFLIVLFIAKEIVHRVTLTLAPVKR